jgi:hypothetical protein
VEDPRRLHRFLYPPSLFAKRSAGTEKRRVVRGFSSGNSTKIEFCPMQIDHEECRRLAASCRRLAKTAPSSFLAAKLEEMAKKWLEVAAELKEVEASLERHEINEKKAG